MTAAPDVIDRYLAADRAKDATASAACFTKDSTATDEGRTHTGRDEITAWREKTFSAWNYTSTVTSSEPAGDAGYRVGVHLEGDFPGGMVDLTLNFTLDGNLISHLMIS